MYDEKSTGCFDPGLGGAFNSPSLSLSLSHHPSSSTRLTCFPVLSATRRLSRPCFCSPEPPRNRSSAAGRTPRGRRTARPPPSTPGSLSGGSAGRPGRRAATNSHRRRRRRRHCSRERKEGEPRRRRLPRQARCRRMHRAVLRRLRAPAGRSEEGARPRGTGRGGREGARASTISSRRLPGVAKEETGAGSMGRPSRVQDGARH